MSRENVDAKARRYLIEGRVTVTCVQGDDIEARSHGAGEVHQCGHSPAKGWFCGCSARATCSHLAALQLVAVRRNHR
jgi:hypothetical protein